MFGGKKKENQESQYARKAVVDYLAQNRGMLEANSEENQVAGQQVKNDLEKICLNETQAQEVCQLLLEDMECLHKELEALCQEAPAKKETLGQITATLKEHSKECFVAVDNAKHLAGPWKHLTEMPARIQEPLKGVDACKLEMDQIEKQMGILALNAAIEAGRMGESGASFVAAAENIRGLTRDYGDQARELEVQLALAQDRVKNLEETVNKLEGLLKENNAESTRLLYKAQELATAGENTLEGDSTDRLRYLADQVSASQKSMKEMQGRIEGNQELLKETGNAVEQIQERQNASNQVEKEVFLHMDVMQ